MAGGEVGLHPQALMEFIYNAYNDEWRDSAIPGATLTQRVEAFLDRIQACGFTAVSVNERFSALTAGSAAWDLTSAYHLLENIGGVPLINRIRLRGLRVLLRLWGDVTGVMTTRQLGGLWNAVRTAESHASLNPFGRALIEGPVGNDPRSWLQYFAQALKDHGLYERADWISIGWDTSGEIDNIRGFPEGGSLPHVVRPPVPTRPGVPAGRRAAAGARTTAGCRSSGNCLTGKACLAHQTAFYKILGHSPLCFSASSRLNRIERPHTQQSLICRRPKG